MPLSGILGDVTQERLRGVLLERRPALLDAASPEQVAQFETFVRSAATEVVLLTGYDPPAGPIRDLAVDVIINETGSRIAYQLGPVTCAPKKLSWVPSACAATISEVEMEPA